MQHMMPKYIPDGKIMATDTNQCAVSRRCKREHSEMFNGVGDQGGAPAGKDIRLGQEVTEQKQEAGSDTSPTCSARLQDPNKVVHTYGGNDARSGTGSQQLDHLDHLQNESATGSRWSPTEVQFAVGDKLSEDYQQRVQRLCSYLDSTDLSKMFGDVPDDPNMLGPEYVHYRSLTEQQRETRKRISKQKRSRRKQVREKHRRELGNHYLEHLKLLLAPNVGASVVEIVHGACDLLESYASQAGEVDASVELK